MNDSSSRPDPGARPGTRPGARRARIRYLALLALAAAALFLLALGAGTLPLQPGDPLAFNLFQSAPFGGALGGSGADWPITVVRIVMLLAMVFLPVYLVYALVSRRARRQLISTLLITAVLLLALGGLSRCTANARPQLDLAAGEAQQPPPEMPTPEPLPLPDLAPPEWLVLLASVLAALAVVAAAAAVVWWWRRRRGKSPTELEQLAQGAQNAIDALRAGADFRDAVIRCYAEMGRVLQDRRGIARPNAMTPREFEQELLRKGLPAEPVRRLTRLFEAARYGDQPARPPDEQLALDSLAAIVAACRSQR